MCKRKGEFSSSPKSSPLLAFYSFSHFQWVLIGPHLPCTVHLMLPGCVCVFISEYWCVHVCVCQICGSCQLVSPQDEHSTSHLQDPLTPAFSPGTNNTSLDLVRGGYMVLMFNKQHAELGLPSRTLGVITSYPSWAGLGREDATHDW